ncbi:hypothetical protein DSM104299_00315 [Baekduia alba]|nr:hypothetical protein [Baekduia alba]WCB91642.1 hypothetical protein DSM104299_00315 [Baekduia alba]
MRRLLRRELAHVGLDVEDGRPVHGIEPRDGHLQAVDAESASASNRAASSAIVARSAAQSSRTAARPPTTRPIGTTA